MSLFSFVYMLLSVILIRTAGPIGHILANALNMGMRISYSIVFIKSFFKNTPSFTLWRALPSPQVLVVFLGSIIITQITREKVMDPERFFTSIVLHVGVGLGCITLLAISIYKYEKPFLRDLRSMKDGGQKAEQYRAVGLRVVVPAAEKKVQFTDVLSMF